jgi:hypothetical protein
VNHFDPPYVLRILALLVFLAGGFLVAWMRGRDLSLKRRESAALLIGGLAASLVGVVNDQITCSISLEYFTLGKGIEGGAGFRLRVAELGAKAGFSAGVIASAVLLFASSHGRDCGIESLRSFARSALRSARWALALGVTIGIVFPSICPPPLIPDFEPSRESREYAFLHAWGTHIGLYGGLAVGIAVEIARLRRRARLDGSADSMPSPEAADRESRGAPS